jgi:hypothetical protein
MRRGQLVLLALLPFSVATAAQAQEQSQFFGKNQLTLTLPQSETVLAHASLEDVVSRMMSFDRNSDGKVQKAELSERMYNLMSRGDADHDGALDRTEILTLATAPAATATGRGFQGPSGYSFADQVGLSSRAHIEGSLEDLRLVGAKKDQAQTIVKAYVDALEKSASADLLNEVGALLAPPQLTAFKAALETKGRFVTLNGRNGERTQVMMGGVDLGQRIDSFRLPPAQHQQARAAVDRYKARLRVAGPERSELLAQLNGILSADEQDDFSAALERRPVVANNGLSAGFFVTSGTFKDFVIDGSPATPGTLIVR